MNLPGWANRSRRLTFLLVVTSVVGMLAVAGLLLFGAFEGKPGIGEGQADKVGSRHGF